MDGFFGDKWNGGAAPNADGQWQICSHECGSVTAEQGARWNKGKAQALTAVTKYVGKGPYFANGDPFMGIGSNLNGHWDNDKKLKKGDPRDNIQDVQSHLSNHTYFYMSCTADEVWSTETWVLWR